MRSSSSSWCWRICSREARQLLDHAVEAFAQIFDFVAGAADLDRLEFTLPDGSDSGLQQRQRPRQQTDGEARDGRRHHATTPHSTMPLATSKVCWRRSQHRTTTTTHKTSTAVKMENLDASDRKLGGRPADCERRSSTYLCCLVWR